MLKIEPDAMFVEMQAEIDRLREALKEPEWKSADKDNMEFEARITCWQMDNIRAALKTGK